MSAIQWNELEVPSPCPSTEKYMKGIPRQKCLCESFGIQVGDYKTLLKPKNREGSLHTSGSALYGPVYGPEQPHVPIVLALALLVHSPIPGPLH